MVSANIGVPDVAATVKDETQVVEIEQWTPNIWLEGSTSNA
jgi:hypothetical protein